VCIVPGRIIRPIATGPVVAMGMRALWVAA